MSCLLYAVGLTYLGNFLVPRSGKFFRCTALYGSDDVTVDLSLGAVVSKRLIELILLSMMLGLNFCSEIRITLCIASAHPHIQSPLITDYIFHTGLDCNICCVVDAVQNTHRT
ncbi:MAG: hypothetical protein ABI045_00380 [Flavobacteriales bacterium]